MRADSEERWEEEIVPVGMSTRGEWASAPSGTKSGVSWVVSMRSMREAMAEGREEVILPSVVLLPPRHL